MANGYPNLESPLSQSPLMQMLLNIQRQGAIEKAQTGPMILQSLSGMADAIRAQKAQESSQQFADAQRRKAEAFGAKQDYTNWNRGRMDAREERGFRERMAKIPRYGGGDPAVALDKLLIDIEDRIANIKANGGDASGLERERDRLLGKREGAKTAEPSSGLLGSMAGSKATPTPQEHQRAFMEAVASVAPPLQTPAPGRMTGFPRSPDEANVNRVVNTIKGEVEPLFGAGEPKGAQARFYKLVVDDIEDGVVDEARLVARARDRLADAATRETIFGKPPSSADRFDTEMSSAVKVGPYIPPASKVPSEQEIATFVKIALRRLGKS